MKGFYIGIQLNEDELSTFFEEMIDVITVLEWWCNYGYENSNCNWKGRNGY